MKNILVIIAALLSLCSYGQSREWLQGKVNESKKAYIKHLDDDDAKYSINDHSITNAYYSMCYENGILDSIEFAYLGEAGSKLREDGIYEYATKLYDLSGLENDATQTTASLQPYKSGHIAPTENVGLKNPNGDTRYITHPEISFAADEAWSVTTVLNWNGSNLSDDYYAGTAGLSRLSLRVGSSNKYYFYNGANGDVSSSTNGIIGKNTVVTFIADGYGTIKVYENGVQKTTITTVSSMSFSELMKGRYGYTYSNISAHIIRAEALTASQVLAEATFLQTIYPEVPSVQIGTQTWATSNCEMVATPQGNVITNVTEDAIWASSQTLYDNYLTANPGDTYGATKAAAMWCYYNNDSQIGSWAGKLYNWYAVSLIQQDIDLYNIANPSAHWGWHVPSEAELNTLATYLGGASVAGGKMKKDGLDYWNSPNTGADNSSGFSALGCGRRADNGSIGGLKTTFTAHSITQIGSNNDQYSILETSGVLTMLTISKKRGLSLRLIKD